MFKIFTKLKPIYLLAILFLDFTLAKAQNTHTISGIITDQGTGETLVGATIKLDGTKQVGTISNPYGFYSITIPDGQYEITISYIGYSSVSQKFDIKKDIKLNFQLVSSTQLQEVIVSAEKRNENISNPQMGVEKLNVKDIKNIPVLFGERDVLKTIQLLPGISSAGEGNSGFYVRGGASDHNLILLDEAPVYNASHLLGFFSTFNSDAVKDVTVYKGGMPAQYGGRLASVLDIRMNDGNKNDYTFEGGIGLISSKLKVEGPISKGKSSFMLSGRRTYADMFLALSPDSTLRGNKLYFYDFNAKTNFIINDRNTIFVSGYFGRDRLYVKNAFGFDWGNSTATLRWNHIYSNRLFGNTSLIYSNYDYRIESLIEDNDFKVASTIRDFNLKQDFQYSLNNHNLKFGFNAIKHKIEPGKITSSELSSINERKIENRSGFEGALYLSDEWKTSDKITLAYGLRLSYFAMLGKGTFSTYDVDGDIIESRYYGNNEVVKSYLNLEPRVSASFQLDDDKSIKGSFTRNTQNLHLMSNSTTTSPTDIYIMSSNNTKPEIADQVALGYFNNFANNNYEFSAELYHKWMNNQIDYKTGTDLRGNENVEADLLYGKGRAYGLELFLKKKYGKFNGWIGYTLAKTERQFEGIDNGRWFNAKQDRTHDLSIVGIYKASEKWTLSSAFVYNTGNAISFPEGKYQVGGNTVFYYAERNGYRTPSYHRLDVSATLEGKQRKNYQSSWSFGIYNLYNRKNAYSIDFREVENDRTKTEIVKTSLFGIIPSVTWNFKF
ncbi:TonB-dependent receptor plug [Pseudopedobacter saltans DSM 12145]|uniref:TonB-dependent receptor plug n=1 Tax=Pseudopedobacter saltans (strain ATCC 51119 / DSM 12145 / JCM 21818 / CCUG 39354 / LMG 10337 / NBRC 100064 / NCIMB 13643) TaxID=762903 RepID=F0SD36_PSESL|nr:TonB-dependent receptor [Pseudopedobacter saltans]ADY51793.1 TonB-dependent receptor plug [Pseudopedobacter saltans DSM 12145]